MNLSNPDVRRGLRAVIEALAAVALVALLYWLTSLLGAFPRELSAIARGALIILGLNAIFYGAENVSRAIKLTGPLGTGAEFGPEAPAAAQKVADSAQDAANEVKDAAS